MGPFIPRAPVMKVFREKGTKMLNDRQKLGKSRQDIFTHLLGEHKEMGRAFTETQLLGSADLVIIAGTGPFPPPRRIEGRIQGLRAVNRHNIIDSNLHPP